MYNIQNYSIYTDNLSTVITYYTLLMNRQLYIKVKFRRLGRKKSLLIIDLTEYHLKMEIYFAINVYRASGSCLIKKKTSPDIWSAVSAKDTDSGIVLHLYYVIRA